MQMWKRLDIKGKILIPLCSGIFLVIAVLMAVGFSMLNSEKNFAGQLRNDFIVSLYDIASSDRTVQMEKAANILINTDEVVTYLEDTNASESVRMVLDGVLLSIGENMDIRRFALYDQNYSLVSGHAEPGVPSLPQELDPAHRGPFEMCAQEYDFRTFQRSIENSGQVEMEICMVTVVTDWDDEVIGFVEVATKPAAFAANIQERTGSQNAFLGKGATSFACASESELFSNIAKTLDSGADEQESARGKAGKMHFLADKVPVLAADGSHLGDVWVVNDDSANVAAQNKTLLIGGIVVLATAIGIILFLMLLLRNSIVMPLDNVMTRVSGASGLVSSASYQIAGTSSQLAGNSTEQAASLEETSASLLDLSAKTAQNSKSTHEADNLMAETQSRVAHGREATQSMIETINSIKTSSDETAKIISTINEIAFQTNLLALNAAVEAARAGDYGRGFAVVAEEVGNLAMRSQQAAQSTAQIIDEARTKADNGVEVVQQVSEGLDSIQESTETCGSLITGIAEATEEQSLVIEQLNQAMSDINLVVQQGAANAEESASTSEELSGQASELDSLVEEMSGVIKGSRD